jgi:RNA polymerase sigma-70 factor (ECF subfamily)
MLVQDRELVAACVAGDGGAWREFVRRFETAIRGMACAALRSMGRSASEPDVDEIASRVLAMLVEDSFRALRAFRWNCSLLTWLRILVRTACTRSVRRKAVEPERLGMPPSPEEPLDHVLSLEASEQVRDAIARLPERERSALTLYFVEGRSYEDIGRTLGLPVGTVGTILARTRAALRQLLRSRGLA